MDIEKQLGLGYLDKRSKGDSSNRNQIRTPGTDPVEMLTKFGRPLLKAIAQNNGTDRLYPLLERLQMPISVALPVVEFLEREDLVEITDRDLKGNYQLRLTNRGKGMIE
jgi:hypothetical protein